MEIRRKGGIGYDTNPALSDKEAARRPAHGLLDSNPTTSQMRIALRRTTSRNADREKPKVKLYENTH
jgi:hypothetical protein